MNDNQDLIDSAREWMNDCSWKEDPEDLAELSDAEVLRGVQKHYAGGLNQFRRDGC